MKPSIQNLRKLIQRSRWGAVELAPKREVSGAARPAAEELLQPQDGARTDIQSESPHASRDPYTRLNEPDDARLTGMTRSLGRRLLGLNVTAKPKPVMTETFLLPQNAGKSGVRVA